MLLDVQQYAKNKQKLSELIEADSDEPAIQRFIENNPHLLMRPPQGLVLDVATQWPLGTEFRADFGYWWHDSTGGYIHLIEIEQPGLQIFTSNDLLTATANKACQQLRDWEEYVSRELDTIETMISTRRSSYSNTRRVSFTLVMGRRAQITSERRKSRWRSLSSSSPDLKVRTWDGFLEEMTYFAGLERNSFSLLRYRQGGFQEYRPDENQEE